MRDISEVKSLIKEIIISGIDGQNDLLKDQHKLADRIFNVSLSLLTEQKMQKSNFTINNNTEIRKYIVSEDEIPEPNMGIISYLTGNVDALYELIATKLADKKKSYATEYHLFYMSIFSFISDEYCDVFFISKKGKFWIYTDSIKEISLSDYISTYLVEMPDSIRGKIEKLFDDKKRTHNEIQKEMISIAEELSIIARGKNYDFLSGAITFMDFLGWKGLWQSRKGENHLETVSNLINDIKEVVKKYTKEVFPYSDEIELSKLISISDTIAIFTPEVGNCDKITLLELHAKIAKYILEKCVESTYPIRGAIAFGKYNTKNNIMIGPGIDECASWHETSNWIGVHFTPSAELLIDYNGGKESNLVKKYDIPVKSGYPKLNYCVNWNVSKDAFRQLMQEVNALLPEISSKYMNTYKYLKETEGESNGENAVS